MKILIVSQRYWPENFRITDIAEELVKQGHDVTVLTGLPNYPQGYIYDGYKKRQNRRQVHNGVKIIRAKEIARRHNILFRFLNYYSYPHYAKKLVNKLDKDFDVVLINELSPIMMCKPAFKYKKKYGTRVVMYEMDLWPESLLAGGIKKNGLLYKHYKKVSSKMYSQCDKILVSTKEHIDYIKALPKCSNLDIDYLPQYAESIFTPEECKKEPNDTFDFMFAGNIGKAQNVDVIVDAANELKEHKNIKFHIAGDGSEKARLEKKAKDLKLDNITFYGSHPLSEMPKFYSMADVMLVTLEDTSYANMTIPGKVQSYMAAGKPILSCAPGATNRFIDETSIGKSIGDNFAKSVIDICDKKRIAEYSKKSLEIYKNLFQEKIFIDKLQNELEKNKR